MEEIIFKSDIQNYSIKFIKMNNICKMEDVTCDYIYPKIFFKLLRDATDSLKESGTETIMQSVNKQDYDDYLKNKTTWKLISNNSDVYLLSCNIDDFLHNMQLGLGL